MTDLNELETRLEKALGRLRRAVEARADRDAGGDDVAELQAENARLSEDLSDLRAQRDRDIAELDTLIAQLKPLVEEVG